MYLVNEQYIALIEICEHGNKVAGFFNCRTRGDAHINAHLICDDSRKCCLTKSGRAMQQNVVKRLVAHPRCVNKHAQVILCLFLSDIFTYCFGAQPALTGILG